MWPWQGPAKKQAKSKFGIGFAFFVVCWCDLAAASNWWPWCNPTKGVFNQMINGSSLWPWQGPAKRPAKSQFAFWLPYYCGVVCFCCFFQLAALAQPQKCVLNQWCDCAASSNWRPWCNPQKGAPNQVNEHICVAMARAGQEASQTPIWLWASFCAVYCCDFAAPFNWWPGCNPKKGFLNQVSKDNLFVAMARASQEASHKPIRLLASFCAVYWWCFCCFFQLVALVQPQKRCP